MTRNFLLAYSKVSTGLKFCRVDVLQELHKLYFDNSYDVTIAIIHHFESSFE